MSGIALYSAQGFLVENCTITDNFDTGGLLAVDHDGSHDIVWRDCVVLRNRSQFEFCDGWHASGSIPRIVGRCLPDPVEYPLAQNVNLTVERTSSMDNLGGGFSGAYTYGFDLAYCKNLQMIDCHASGNNSKDEFSGGFTTFGGRPGGESENIIFINCTAQENGSLGGSILGAGFYCDRASKSIIFQNCTATSNGLFESENSGGFVVYPEFGAGGAGIPELEISNVVFDNCTAISNGNTDSGLSGGFIVNRPADLNWLDISDIIIQDCTSAHNKGAGFGVFGDAIPRVVIKASEADNNTGVGFDVSQNPQPVFVTANIAYDNTGGNYAGVSPSVIIKGDQNTLPDTVGAKNLDIVSVS